jgi:formylglycine-generating enzyme required for sulfatase activity
VVNVSFNDAVAFCKWLSEQEKRSYRLPSEAEWEGACRAGTDSLYQHGDDPEGLASVGNAADATVKAMFSKADTISARDGYLFTAPVGRFKSNAFGLYDMHGNVWEWCADRYDGNYYRTSPSIDPEGPATGLDRVVRGGSWYGPPRYSRSADRSGFKQSYRSSSLGFRVALSIAP